jgi:hypothetical protein
LQIPPSDPLFAVGIKLIGHEIQSQLRLVVEYGQQAAQSCGVEIQKDLVALQADKGARPDGRTRQELTHFRGVLEELNASQVFAKRVGRRIVDHVAIEGLCNLIHGCLPPMTQCPRTAQSLFTSDHRPNPARWDE